MHRVSFLLVAALFGCGPKPAPTNLAPLPEDKPVAEAAKPEPTPAPEKEAAPPAPLEPVEVTIPASKVTIKLVSPGKGKRTPLRYSATAGGKQEVEVAMDFASKQSMNGETQEQVVPTVVLTGNAETTSVDQDGTAAYAFTMSTADAREAKGSDVPLDKFKHALSSLTGLVMSGSVKPNGTAGDTKLRIEKPDELSVGALDLIRVTLPAFPVLPTEPVGIGAKWRATWDGKLADKLEITQVTDYELVAKKGSTWTIKGKTKVSGADQEAGQGAKIKGIKGTGTTEASLTEGALYPTTKSSTETQFTASEKGPDGTEISMLFTITVGGAITAK